MKTITVIIDGADRADYTGLTFPKLAIESGMKNNTPNGMEPNSLACIMNMLGVAPSVIPTGRAYLETLAKNITVLDDDIVLRCNGVRIENGILLSSNDKAPPKLELTDAEIIPLGGYKNLLILHGDRLAEKYFNSIITYAPHDHWGEAINNLLPSCANAEIQALLRELCLKYHLMPWGQSVKTEFDSFYDLHKKSGAIICKTEIVKGIAKALLMYCPEIKNTTAETDTDLTAKAEATLQLSKKYDFTLLHINGADEAAHRRNPQEKAEFMRQIEDKAINLLLYNKPAETELIVTSDHATDSATGKHKNTKVPWFRF